MAQRPPRWSYFVITVIVILAALLALSAVAPGSAPNVRINSASD